MIVYLALPFPPKALSPNARPHYMAKARAAKEYRERCYYEALIVRNRKTIALKAPVSARVTFRCFPRMWDEDNCTAAFKAGWDGIVDSGLIPGDSPDLLHVETEVFKGPRSAMVMVRLEGAE